MAISLDEGLELPSSFLPGLKSQWTKVVSANPRAIAAIVAALIVGTLTAFTPRLFNDGDTWMHIAAGQRMLELGAVLHTDPFSYTFASQPWQTHEWLSEVVMALAFRTGGWVGVSLLFGLAAGAGAGLLTCHVGRWITGLPLTCIVLLGLMCQAPGLLARPHVLAMPLLELWTAELVISRSEGRAPSLARLAPLMVVWANLHGSFLFGLGLLGAFGLEAAWRARKSSLSVLRPWFVLCPVVLAATVVSPHGIENLLFPFRLMKMTTLSNINEWAPIAVSANPAFEAGLFFSAFILIWKRVRIEMAPLLVLLLLVYLALQHERHLQLLGVVGPLLVACPLGEMFAVTGAERNGSGRGGAGWPVAAGVALAILMVATRLILPFSPADSVMSPGLALAHVPSALRSRPMFNDYAYGGFLIFNGVKPYTDSRAEVYGDPFRSAYLRMITGDQRAFDREIVARRIAWTMLTPTSPLVAILDASPDWRRLYADKYAVVHARREGPISPPASLPGARG